ncbi:MAG: hypothetical protein FWH05_05640 [Oscillospiraceae bacterium]|nr:hypothetical protein [Oscillospiraceae bacterium]
MVKLITGRRGSGKTKHLIHEIHIAEKNSKGNVVAIQVGSSLNVDIYHKIRLINIEDYKIKTTEAMFGFVAGLLASNYDCTDIFIDGVLSVVGRDLEQVGKMFDNISCISSGTNIVFTFSADIAEIPENIKKYL